MVNDSDKSADNVIITPTSIDVNLSPNAFYHWAKHFYAAKQSFRCPDPGFSPVPYFLLGRAIELVIKARHLTRATQQTVKKGYSHDFAAAYKALEPGEQVLSPGEVRLLRQAAAVYKTKAFEYFQPRDALTAFKRFPDLRELDQVARKLLNAWADLDLFKR